MQIIYIHYFYHMKKSEKVSVIVPCYNHAAFLTETIESVLKSTYQTIEIIIVDDGSKDESAKVGKALADKYSQCRYLYQENEGPAAARNNGIRHSSGEFILPLDADDLISENYIEEAVKVLKTNEQVEVVYCEAEFFEGKTGEWKLPPFSRQFLARDNMIFCSAVYRKSGWEATGGYDERMTWGWEDWEFWMNLLKRGGEVYRLPFVGFYYRVRPNSRRKSTNSDAKKKTIDLINSKHKEFVNEMLKGPLRYQRSLSVCINSILSFFRFPLWKSLN